MFGGSVPDYYRRVMVPTCFAPYAAVVAERIAAARPQRILETAAGTGVLTRALTQHLPAADIVATDLNQTMLDRADPLPRVRYRQADAQDLPFDVATFDAVVSQFGLMFLPDKALGHAQARRVLSPAGQVVHAVWDSLARNEFHESVDATLTGAGLPSVFARLFGYHDPEQLEADARAGGFTDVTVEAVELTSRAPDAFTLADGMVRGTPVFADLTARRADVGAVVDAVAAALRARFGTGEIVGAMSALVLTAR